MMLEYFGYMAATVLCLFLPEMPVVNAAKGREFVVAFPAHRSSADPSLVITCAGSTPINVTVTAPEARDFWNSTSFLVCSENQDYLEISFNTHFVLMVDGTDRMAIHIQASDDIIVLARSMISLTGQNSAGACLVHPLALLSRYYVTVTACELNDCFILIVSGGVSVAVTVTLAITPVNVAPAARLTYKGQNYASGDNLVESLRAWNTMQILSTLQDLTGTAVNANDTVAVFCGGSFTYIGSGSKDQIVEQMPAASSLGDSYVVQAFPTVGATTLVKVVYLVPGTRLIYDNAVMSLSGSSTYGMQLELLEGSATVLEATAPVLVAVLSRSGMGKEPYDPSAVVVLPTLSWLTRYVTVLVIEEKEIYSYTIVTRMSCSSSFYLDSVTLIQLNWTPVANDTYKMVQLLITTTGKHVLENADCPFGGYIMAVSAYRAYSYALGWEKLLIDNSSSSSSSLSVMLTADSSEIHISSDTCHFDLTVATTATFKYSITESQDPKHVSPYVLDQIFSYTSDLDSRVFGSYTSDLDSRVFGFYTSDLDSRVFRSYTSDLDSRVFRSYTSDLDSRVFRSYTSDLDSSVFRFYTSDLDSRVFRSYTSDLGSSVFRSYTSDLDSRVFRSYTSDLGSSVFSTGSFDSSGAVSSDLSGTSNSSYELSFLFTNQESSTVLTSSYQHELATFTTFGRTILASTPSPNYQQETLSFLSPTNSLIEASTALATATPPADNADPGRNRKQCPCLCAYQANSKYFPLYNTTIVKSLAHAISQAISVKATRLSSAKRKNVSSDNKVISSVYMGRFICAIFFSVFAGFLIFSDVCRLAYWAYLTFPRCWRGKKHA